MKMAVIIHYYLHNLDQSRQQWEYSDLCLIRWGGGGGCPLKVCFFTTMLTLMSESLLSSDSEMVVVIHLISLFTCIIGGGFTPGEEGCLSALK